MIAARIEAPPQGPNTNDGIERRGCHTILFAGGTRREFLDLFRHPKSA
jgi:hypothetical protein